MSIPRDKLPTPAALSGTSNVLFFGVNLPICKFRYNGGSEMQSIVSNE